MQFQKLSKCHGNILTNATKIWEFCEDKHKKMDDWLEV